MTKQERGKATQVEDPNRPLDPGLVRRAMNALSTNMTAMTRRVPALEAQVRRLEERLEQQSHGSREHQGPIDVADEEAREVVNELRGQMGRIEAALEGQQQAFDGFEGARAFRRITRLEQQITLLRGELIASTIILAAHTDKYANVAVGDEVFEGVLVPNVGFNPKLEEYIADQVQNNEYFAMWLRLRDPNTKIIFSSVAMLRDEIDGFADDADFLM